MKILTFVSVLLIAFAISGFAQTKKAKAKSQARPAARDRAFEPVTDDPKLPRVLLIEIILLFVAIGESRAPSLTRKNARPFAP